MKKQKIIWTALPNGFETSEEDQKQLKLSVFVSPRLKTDENLPEPILSQFPDFAGNWVKKVSGISFEVKFQNGETVPAHLDESNLDPKLWEQLFHEETYVRPFEFRDLSNRSIRTYPIKGVMSYLHDRYVEIAEKSPGKLPLLEPERDDDGKPIGDPGATLEGFIDDIGDLLTPEKEILCKITGEEYYAFREATKEEEQAASGVQQGRYYVLAYIRACLKNKKIKLTDNAKIELVNDLIWKIIDGENEYFVEDSGSSIVVYQYGDIYQDVDQVLQINKVLDPSKLYGYTKAQLDFLQANRFYDRREDKREFHLKPNAKHVPPSLKVEKMDFHQMLAMLGDHPLIMRKLGLVLDLTISSIPDHPVHSVKVMVKWRDENQPSSFHEDSTPITLCILKNKRFIAKPRPAGNIVDGMLNLKGADDKLNGNPSKYSLLQIDPEGSALKSMRAGSSMVRQFKRKYKTTFSADLAKQALQGGCDLQMKVLQGLFQESMDGQEQLTDKAKISVINGNKWIVSDKGKQFEIVKTAKSSLHVFEKKTTSFDTPEDSGLPALRTAGISVFKTGRAHQLFDRLTANLATDALLTSTSDIKLYADDLVRGYRVDVLDNTLSSDPEWRSLCRRTGQYFIGNDALNPSAAANPISVDDEGYVKGASATSSDAKDSDLYLNETMFRWDGWSMVAQRPGKTIAPVPGEKLVYLFDWNDVSHDNTEFIAFLKKTFHARWTEKKKTTIQAQGTDTILVDDGTRFIKLTINNENVTLTTDTGRQYFYTSKNENGHRNVYNSVPVQGETPKAIINKAETEFEFGNVFSATPGSLPQLRFGHTYNLRARSVDIAGNSISWKSDDDSATSESIQFTRFEPLIPPTLVPRAQFTEGEAVEHLVIRSNFDQTSKDYIASEEVAKALQDEDYKYEEGTERHIIPPKTSQLIAETHSEFDKFFGAGKDYEQGYRIALKEEGTITDREIVNINTGLKEPIPTPDDIQIIIPAHEPGIPDEDVPGQYAIHKEEQLLLPYLPDPIARGAVLRDLPGITASGTPTLEVIIDPVQDLNLLKVPFDMNWPNSLPFRIRIEERPGHMKGANCDQSFVNTDDPPGWDAENRILTVYLGKADVKTIKYSCYFNKDDLANMGIWKWLWNSPHRNELRRYGLSGTHWMMTPFREFTLVHAVQQPLCEPTLPLLNGIKHKIGDTMAEIRGELYQSSKSTDKVNLLAYWTEPVDDNIPSSPPHTKDVHANAFEVKIDSSFDNKIKLPLFPCMTHNHEFGDTKYRHVQYYLTGACRFREYFHPTISGTGKDHPEAILDFCFEWNNIPGTDEHLILNFLKHIRQINDPTSASISKSTDGSTITVTEDGKSLDLQLNTDQNGLIMTLADAKTYVFVLSLNEDNKLCLRTDKISRQGPFIEADILNSARPLAPKVQYILPTFGWKQKTDNNKDKGWKSFQRTRKGGGLRVYLDRPWYSSGDGELLGVTLYPHLVPDQLKPYATQWGMDPIRKSKIPKGGLNIGDFENVEHGQTNLSFAELSGPKLNVAGFKVEYNSDRELWYSDIQIDSDIMISYFPFIRLALARYQPSSITNAHLSNIVLTDFVQIANDRTLNIERKQRRQEIHVTVTGRATGDRSSNRVEAAIESLAPGANPELGWIQIKGSRTQPNPYTLKMSPVDTSTYLWKWEGNLRLPKTRSGHTYRLVVREYEQFDADANMDNITMSITALGPQQYVKNAERMVYVDIVKL